MTNEADALMATAAAPAGPHLPAPRPTRGGCSLSPNSQRQTWSSTPFIRVGMPDTPAMILSAASFPLATKEAFATAGVRRRREPSL